MPLMADGFGNAEAALTVAALGPILFGIVSFFLKDAIKSGKETKEATANLDKRVAVLEAQTHSATLSEHQTRLTVLETGMAELKADVRVVRRWVENQGSGHRPPTDKYDSKG